MGHHHHSSTKGQAINGPDADFTGGNQVNILNAKSDKFTPTSTKVTQNTGRKVTINGGVKNGVEHVVFNTKLQNLQLLVPVHQAQPESFGVFLI